MKREHYNKTMQRAQDRTLANDYDNAWYLLREAMGVAFNQWLLSGDDRWMHRVDWANGCRHVIERRLKSIAVRMPE